MNTAVDGLGPIFMKIRYKLIAKTVPTTSLISPYTHFPSLLPNNSNGNGSHPMNGNDESSHPLYSPNSPLKDWYATPDVELVPLGIDFTCSVPSHVLLATRGESREDMIRKAVVYCTEGDPLSLGFVVCRSGLILVFSDEGYPLQPAEGCVAYLKRVRQDDPFQSRDDVERNRREEKESRQIAKEEMKSDVVKREITQVHDCCRVSEFPHNGVEISPTTPTVMAIDTLGENGVSIDKIVDGDVLALNTDNRCEEFDELQVEAEDKHSKVLVQVQYLPLGGLTHGDTLPFDSTQFLWPLMDHLGAVTANCYENHSSKIVGTIEGNDECIDRGMGVIDLEIHEKCHDFHPNLWCKLRVDEIIVYAGEQAD